ncbi:hypothetical protein ACFGVS_07855 [Mucilaginibacter sp. AW1-7]|jgi:hypothetical protein|uniref:hypothetical protein n=1 Tax=Mucilaginibacter sp. AW1-7 TaxID=3349874 RepID=UPI003F736454
MNEIKSLADQIRGKINQPEAQVAPKPVAVKKKQNKAEAPEIVELLRGYDISGHKSMVHARFDAQTAQMLHYFKMATGVEVTRLVAYSVRQLFEQHPELKIIIKQYIQQLEL